jgi:hypothetical protein
MTQLDEMTRFLEFQASLISKLGAQKDDVKRQRQAEHARILSEQSLKVSTLPAFFLASLTIIRTSEPLKNLRPVNWRRR